MCAAVFRLRLSLCFRLRLCVRGEFRFLELVELGDLEAESERTQASGTPEPNLRYTAYCASVLGMGFSSHLRIVGSSPPFSPYPGVRRPRPLGLLHCTFKTDPA